MLLIICSKSVFTTLTAQLKKNPTLSPESILIFMQDPIFCSVTTFLEFLTLQYD